MNPHESLINLEQGQESSKKLSHKVKENHHKIMRVRLIEENLISGCD
jgi:hypothetical protein